MRLYLFFPSLSAGGLAGGAQGGGGEGSNSNNSNMTYLMSRLVLYDCVLSMLLQLALTPIFSSAVGGEEGSDEEGSGEARCLLASPHELIRQY